MVVATQRTYKITVGACATVVVLTLGARWRLIYLYEFILLHRCRVGEDCSYGLSGNDVTGETCLTSQSTAGWQFK